MSEETKQQDKRATPDEVIARQRNRQLLIITAVIAVLALGVWITRATKDTEQGVQTLPLVGGTTDEPAFDKEDVANIQIWRGDDKLELRKEGGGWRVPARYNVPADTAAVGSLLTKVFDGRRLNRAATTATENFVLYQVDDSSTHLRLAGAEGNELLHLVVGQAESGGRTFVRYLGDE
jgi:hypothetical protein